MHEKVREFLNACRVKEQAERNELLISLGLFEKEYSPDGKYNSVYSNIEYGKSSGEDKYYKKVPVPVSDEEYALIKKYAQREGKGKAENGIAGVLMGLGVLTYAAGGIAGIFLAVASDGLAVLLLCWAASLVGGTMLLGFSEIIKLLASINNK